KQAAESVRGGIIIGLGSRLQVFQNQLICEMTSCDDIDLELPGRQKCAYFCITSDQDSTFDYLSSLFFSFLFIKLVRYADKHCTGGKLTVPVTFVCDEFPNIGTIPDFCKKISTVRSRGLNISIIFLKFC
ncbi:MAG: type IV secretory system conjugative DNA transfer family protein, partial [Clostridia bacterium]|nr:type IV secretory system conjugative DNA transfer family protein [Clostridia bacterium]